MYWLWAVRSFWAAFWSWVSFSETPVKTRAPIAAIAVIAWVMTPTLLAGLPVLRLRLRTGDCKDRRAGQRWNPMAEPMARRRRMLTPMTSSLGAGL